MINNNNDNLRVQFSILADLSLLAIYIYASEMSRYALSENGIVYYAMT